MLYDLFSAQAASCENLKTFLQANNLAVAVRRVVGRTSRCSIYPIRVAAAITIGVGVDAGVGGALAHPCISGAVDARRQQQRVGEGQRRRLFIVHLITRREPNDSSSRATFVRHRGRRCAKRIAKPCLGNSPSRVSRGAPGSTISDGIHAIARS